MSSIVTTPWYNIEICSNLHTLDKFKDDHVIAIIDQNIHVDLPDGFVKIHLDQHGEMIKSYEYFAKLAEKILDLGITRKTILLAIGGGCVGDVTGFLASTLLRGIRYIQVPTTLLSMVDSSVGGKTAINSQKYKNMIGTFYQPLLVVCNTSFLDTLPHDELLCGFAEVVKYGLIYDKEFYQYLTKEKWSNLQYIIRRCCEIKAEIVSQDERETLGLRQLLNFGHTFAHGIEKIYPHVKHGQAVAFGMYLACKFSGGFDDVCYFLQDIGFRHFNFLKSEFASNKELSMQMVTIMAADKKNISHETIIVNDKKIRKEIELILLNSIGTATSKSIASVRIIDFIKNYCLE